MISESVQAYVDSGCCCTKSIRHSSTGFQGMSIQLRTTANLEIITTEPMLLISLNPRMCIASHT